MTSIYRTEMYTPQVGYKALPTLMIFYSMWIIQSAVGSKDAILS